MKTGRLSYKSSKNSLFSNPLSIFASFVLLLTLFVAACGGGGGGGAFSGAANVDINAEPRNIDAGDRMKVRTYISDLHKNGIALKFSFPAKMSYVASTALIVTSDGNEIDISPTNNIGSKDSNYLVFYLQPSDFGDDELGYVEFELSGNESVSDGKLAVDPDVDDPTVDNSVEFNVDAPQFDEEDSISISVEG
jgi:hypothetical protein